MSTNPNDIVRVRARANGRASVYEANAWCQSLSQGVLDGNGVVQNTSADMNVLVGGTSNKPDVVIASNPSGYKIALDIVGQQAVAITAPASNKRITSIVAYTDDLSLASTDENITGSPSSCGLIVVNGTASASPSAPDDATIRTAITDDGATGSQACYCVLAEILVDHTTTTITNSLIDNKISGVNQIADLAVKSNSIDWTTFEQPFSQIISQNTKTTYTETIDCSAIPSGAKFLVIASGYANIDGGSNHGYNFYIEYNSVDVSGTVWGNALTNANTAVPGGTIALITKASGIDSINIKFTSSNCTLREIRFNVCIVPFSS